MMAFEKGKMMQVDWRMGSFSNGFLERGDGGIVKSLVCIWSWKNLEISLSEGKLLEQKYVNSSMMK